MNYLRNDISAPPGQAQYTIVGRTPGDTASSPGAAINELLEAIAGGRQEAGSGSPAPGQPAVPDRALPAGLAPWQVRKVRDHIETSLSGLIRIAVLAGIARLSPGHFTRAFKASFGTTPLGYVNARRVERAKSMMLETADPLSQISLACGFTDQSHLSRVFRRLSGEPPSQWRRHHRQG